MARFMTTEPGEARSPPNGVILALDPGERRIGVAASDETGLLAAPVAVIQRSSRAADLQQIAALIQRYQPVELLVGLALLPSGDRGPQARRGERFADQLTEEFGLPVRLWNESYSTVEARRRRAAAPRARKRSPYLDAEAAAVFLQDYLDSRR
jgi:putative pre-16S rRNA nuclease